MFDYKLGPLPQVTNFPFERENPPRHSSSCSSSAANEECVYNRAIFISECTVFLFGRFRTETQGASQTEVGPLRKTVDVTVVPRETDLSGVVEVAVVPRETDLGDRPRFWHQKKRLMAKEYCRRALAQRRPKNTTLEWHTRPFSTCKSGTN